MTPDLHGVQYVAVGDRMLQHVVPFVLSSWLRAFRPFAMSRYGMTRSEAHRRFHEEAARLVYTQRLVLARLEDDHEVFIGWACGDGRGALHYVYVKDAFRGRGFGRRLATDSGGFTDLATYTFLPPSQCGKPRGWVVDAFERWGLRFEPLGLVKEMETKRNGQEQGSNHSDDQPGPLP